MKLFNHLMYIMYKCVCVSLALLRGSSYADCMTKIDQKRLGGRVHILFQDLPDMMTKLDFIICPCLALIGQFEGSSSLTPLYLKEGTRRF